MYVGILYVVPVVQYIHFFTFYKWSSNALKILHVEYLMTCLFNCKQYICAGLNNNKLSFLLLFIIVVLLITRCRSIAKCVGCFQQHLFVCLYVFVNTMTSE